jgi:hypothetical protein
VISSKHIFSVADELVFRRGEFDPVEFLVSAGLLDEDEHREWLSGRRGELQSRLRCALDDALDALERARVYLRVQGLTAQPRRRPLRDGSAEGPVGASAALAELCSSCLVPAGAQRDLFQDTALAAAESALRTALAEHRLGAAKDGLSSIQALGAPRVTAEGYRHLIEAAERDATDAAADRLAAFEDVITPLASACLGSDAFAYLSKLWRSLAVQLRGAPFLPSSPKLHPSYAHFQAAQWRSVIDDIESDASWRQHPVLVARLAEAYGRLLNRPAARRAWALLYWAHPDAAAEALATASADPLLAKRWREFCDAEPALSAQNFPAWLLLADPSQRGFVPADLAPASPAGSAYAAMHRLLSNHDDIDARRELKAHSADLLEHYLAGRRRLLR